MFYKGWVPTVNGRLSFKLIGECRYPNEPEYVNVADSSHLYIVALQTRQLSDVLFEPIVGPLLGYSGKFDCIFCARALRSPTAPDSKLIGKAYLFRKSAFQKSGDRARVIDAIRSMRTFTPSTSGLNLQADYLKIAEMLDQACDVQMNVVLNRDGIISLSRFKWNNAELRENTVRLSDERDFDVDHDLADQVFFFIRDLTHQHQHHGSDADTITTTQKHEHGDGLSWSLEIMYSLYYHIITIKRKSNPTEHVKALGVLAYLQSYKNIIKARAERSKTELNIPHFDDASTRESIKATKDYIDLRLSEQKRNAESNRSFLIWAFATFITMVNFIVGFADKSLPVSPALSSAANWLRTSAYIVPSAAVIVAIVVASNLLIRAKYDFKRDVVRLAFVNRYASILVFSILGLCFLALCLVLFAKAL